MLKKFKQFIHDDKANMMFIYGQAGTGKTTSLEYIINWCFQHDINHHTCAFTHQAVSILRDKIHHENARISTLYSFLKKKPTINVSALHTNEISKAEKFDNINKETTLLIIDEFSMVEKSDVEMILQYIKNPEYKLKKVLFIGDTNQLPPVNGIGISVPENYEYSFKLTKIYRQENGNPLIDVLSAYVKMIESQSYTIQPDIAAMLKPNSHYIKNVDLIDEYLKSKKAGNSDAILAYTNKSVEYINKQIHALYPVPERWSPTLREIITPLVDDKDPALVEVVNIPYSYDGDTMYAELKDQEGRYYPNPDFLILEKLHKQYDLIKLGIFDTEDGMKTYFYVLGHETHKKVMQRIASDATKLNQEIEEKFKIPATQWVKDPTNRYHPLTIERRERWKIYYAFQNVICIDYPHAITIHKAQGSTFDNVMVKTKEMYDMFRDKQDDSMMFIKLLYVAFSRAKNKVYTD
jgi:ATP-dependent exoDNAse (exonuclease V) alpha subunit